MRPLVDRLSSNGGKPKIIKCSIVGNVNEFLESLKYKDMFDDHELRTLARQAGDIISAIESPFALKYDEPLRNTVREEMMSLHLEIQDSISSIEKSFDKPGSCME